MTWSAKITGADQVAPELQAAVKAGTMAGMEVIGIQGQRLVQNFIAAPYDGQPPAVFSGNLLASIVPHVFEEQSLVRLVIGAGNVNGADLYAAPVETGARPHMPPSEALVLWVHKKLGIEDEKQALSVAFAIAKTIAKRGSRGHEMFSRALVELEPLAGPILEHHIALSMQAAIAMGGR